MIGYLKGNLLEKNKDCVLLEVQGTGYEVLMASFSLERLPGTGEPLEVFISESAGMYGGTITLYGFLSREEKEIFKVLKENVPNTGARKALEYLDKAAKSLPDFRRAILEKDSQMLAGAFGFTKKTAERLIAALKDKLPGALIPGESRLRRMEDGTLSEFSQALTALTSLGYKASEARGALSSLQEELGPQIRGRDLESLIRLCLKKLK